MHWQEEPINYLGGRALAFRWPSSAKRAIDVRVHTVTAAFGHRVSDSNKAIMENSCKRLSICRTPPIAYCLREPLAP